MPRPAGTGGRALGLETFLGGMETVCKLGLRPLLPTLKPSLVEWKLVRTLAVVMAGLVP